MSYNGVKVAHIVATDLNGCIGKDGKMPWHINEDLKRFKRLTEGGVVIMGRKTFESLGCKSLPNRVNIVVSRTNDEWEYSAMLVDDVDDAVRLGAKLASQCGDNKALWIIGGAEIYAQTMPYVDVIEHTVIDIEVENGDAFYSDVKHEFDAIDALETDEATYYTLHRRLQDDQL